MPQKALKFDFDRMNIKIQIINPGFIDTPLTKKNDFSNALFDEGRRGSRTNFKGLKSKKFRNYIPASVYIFVKIYKLAALSSVFLVSQKDNRRPIETHFLSVVI